MEEFWDNNGPYVLAKLADRLVPIPRDTEPQVSLYALCRAWVRNNPMLPLVAEAPLPQLPDPREEALRTGGSASNDAAQAQQLPAGVAAASVAAATPPQDPTAAAPQVSLLQPPASGGGGGSGGLLSILPPVLPPTALETSTAPPTYPLDDFDAQELEEALRKFKEHWVAVRQYHQALRAAKLSRHRERLLALLGEPSVLQPLQLPHTGAAMPLTAPQQLEADVQMGGISGTAATAAAPGVGVGMGMMGLQAQLLSQSGGMGMNPFAVNGAVAGGRADGAGLLIPPGASDGLQQQGLALGVGGFAGAPVGNAAASAESASDVQTALATIMGLGSGGVPAAVAAADPSGGGAAAMRAEAVAQQQQLLFLQLQQQQQQLGLLAGDASVAVATLLPPLPGGGPVAQMGTAVLPPVLEVLQALGHQQQPQPLAQVAAALQPQQPQPAVGGANGGGDCLRVSADAEGRDQPVQQQQRHAEQGQAQAQGRQQQQQPDVAVVGGEAGAAADSGSPAARESEAANGGGGGGSGTDMDVDSAPPAAGV